MNLGGARNGEADSRPRAKNQHHTVFYRPPHLHLSGFELYLARLIRFFGMWQGRLDVL